MSLTDASRTSRKKLLVYPYSDENYTCPEVDGSQKDPSLMHQADVFLCGLICFEILTGVNYIKSLKNYYYQHYLDPSENSIGTRFI